MSVYLHKNDFYNQLYNELRTLRYVAGFQECLKRLLQNLSKYNNTETIEQAVKQYYWLNYYVYCKRYHHEINEIKQKEINNMEFSFIFFNHHNLNAIKQLIRNLIKHLEDLEYQLSEEFFENNEYFAILQNFINDLARTYARMF